MSSSACRPTTCTNDGAGVCYTSYHRPIMNYAARSTVRPGVGAPWQFPADLSIIVGWLEHMGKYDYEVLTDEDLHRDGLAALKPYGTVHQHHPLPNITRNAMLDATEDYSGRGRPPTLPLCQRLLLDGRVPGRRALDHGGPQARSRLAGLAGPPGRALSGDDGRAQRVMAPPWPAAAESSSVSASRPKAWINSVPFRRMPDGYHRSASWIFEGVAGRGLRRQRARRRRGSRHSKWIATNWRSARPRMRIDSSPPPSPSPTITRWSRKR